MAEAEPGTPRTAFRTSALAAVFSLLVLASLLTAQPPPPGPDDEDPPLSSVFGDGGSTTDPSLPPELWTLGDDLLPYDGDPLSLDSEDLYPQELLETEPSVPADPSIAAAGCGNITRTITPIRIGKATADLPNAARYFSYRNNLRALVGVTADAGCHLELPSGLCNWTNHTTTIQAAADAGLNKMRLWVGLSGEKNPNNVPFLQVGTGANAYWNLQEPNPLFFQRLRDVVAFAQAKNQIVEVTFFAPFEGDFFSTGPWGGKGRLPGSTGAFEPVKFSRAEYFVTHDTRPNNAEAVINERMRAAQAKVIEWTVKELWCYDNVYWEIANEPEAQTVNPLDVAQWQREMIARVTAEEAKFPRLAPGGHLVAVQPFTSEGANQFIGDASVDILNGHYTTVSNRKTTTLPFRLDIGALSLIQLHGNRTKLFGFNETKITPFGGKGGTRAHTNGGLTERLAEPARAEAWEFLFDQGAAYDHYGYLSGGDPNTPGTVRRQLGVLAKFINPLPLGRMSSSRNPTWVSINRYPAEVEGLDTVRLAQRYWAALQTKLTDAKRLFLLYLHHSTVRCAASTDNDAPEAEFTVNGCPKESSAPGAKSIFLPRNSYDARIWPEQKYQDRLTLLNLGPVAAKFEVQWITPATGSMPPAQIIDWDPVRRTCNGGSCEIVSPSYSFDIVLRVQQQVQRSEKP